MDAFLTDKAERLACEMASQATTLNDLNGLMRAMMKSALERMLYTEMDHHLKQASPPSAHPDLSNPSDASSPVPAKRNRRNGHSQKTVQGDLGALTLATPRDRNGTFTVTVRPTPFFHPLLASVAFHWGEHHGEGATESGFGASVAGAGGGVGEEREKEGRGAGRSGARGARAVRPCRSR